MAGQVVDHATLIAPENAKACLAQVGRTFGDLVENWLNIALGRINDLQNTRSCRTTGLLIRERLFHRFKAITVV